MIVKRPEVERALDAGGKGYRLILLYGPDEAGSRALADRLGKALGSDAERIDMSGAQIKGDPALLADEAGAISLFGGPRYIRIEPAGDEIADAVAALAELPADSNPIVAVGGALRKDSKLVKLAGASPAMLACASYVPEGVEADRLAATLARDAGLQVANDVARRLAIACNGDRAILAREIEKLALYVDADPAHPREIGHEALDALGAAAEEGDMAKLVDAVLDGQLEQIDTELAQLATQGVEGIPIIRALLRRLNQLAAFRAEVSAGKSVDAVMATSGKALFWKDQKAVQRQLSNWRPETLARAIERLVDTELALKASGSPGPILLDEELIAIGRAARRRR